MEDYKIRVRYVTKRYDLLKTRSEKLRAFFSFKRDDIPEFWSLKGISFDVKPGETLGLVGVNGSGKSTISNIISGIIPQTTGYVDVRGETSVIAIGAGLKGQLTGIENIRLKALMQGLTVKEIEQIMPDIISFADLNDFIYQPVKSYSSGMKSRLGFSIAAHIDPDILIIDEALSVGDSTFYQKCVDKITEFKNQGKTIIFVSHSLKQIRMMCDRVAWIQYGELKDVGPTKRVCDEYAEFVKWFKGLNKAEKKKYQDDQKEAQKQFDIDKFRAEKLQEDFATASKGERRRIVKQYFTEAVGEKMTTSAKWLTAFCCVALVVLALAIFSGHSLTHLMSSPLDLLHPQDLHKKIKAAMLLWWNARY